MGSKVLFNFLVHCRPFNFPYFPFLYLAQSNGHAAILKIQYTYLSASVSEVQPNAEGFGMRYGDVAACFVDSGSNVRTLEIITLLCFVFVAFNKRATVASSRPAACSWTGLD